MFLSKISNILVNPKPIEKNSYPIEIEVAEDKSKKITKVSTVEPIWHYCQMLILMQEKKFQKNVPLVMFLLRLALIRSVKFI